MLKIIPGTGGNYYASEQGDIFSFKRSTSKGGILKRSLSGNQKYPTVKICFGGTQRRRTCHRLIAITFVPNPYNLPEVNHMDGDVQNCEKSNLEWCTRSQNLLHKFRILGWEPSNRKYTKENIFEILSNPSIPHHHFAVKFKTSDTSIRRVRLGKVYIKYFTEFYEIKNAS